MSTALHTITYGYPSSENARRVGRGAQGAYCLAVEQEITGHASYDAALAAVRGTAPSRWSMDHPLNARFLTQPWGEMAGANPQEAVSHG